MFPRGPHPYLSAPLVVRILILPVKFLRSVFLNPANDNCHDIVTIHVTGVGLYGEMCKVT